MFCEYNKKKGAKSMFSLTVPGQHATVLIISGWPNKHLTLLMKFVMIVNKIKI